MGELIMYENVGFETTQQPIQIERTGTPFLTDNTFQWVLNKVDEFVSLDNNWDGYDAIPLIEEVAQIARDFMVCLNDSYLDKISDVFPNPQGTLVIEWENIKKEKLSLEIGVDNYSYFIKYNNDKPHFENGEDIICDRKNITSALDKFFRIEIPTFIF